MAFQNNQTNKKLKYRTEDYISFVHGGDSAQPKNYLQNPDLVRRQYFGKDWY